MICTPSKIKIARLRGGVDFVALCAHAIAETTVTKSIDVKSLEKFIDAPLFITSPCAFPAEALSISERRK